MEEQEGWAPASLLQSSEMELLCPPEQVQGVAVPPSCQPGHHLNTDGNVGQSGDFIFFINFLNSLFFLSHL